MLYLDGMTQVVPASPRCKALQAGRRNQRCRLAVKKTKNSNNRRAKAGSSSITPASGPQRTGSPRLSAVGHMPSLAPDKFFHAQQLGSLLHPTSPQAVQGRTGAVLMGTSTLISLHHAVP